MSEQASGQARQTRDRAVADEGRLEERDDTQAAAEQAALEGTEPLGAEERNEAARQQAEQVTGRLGDPGTLVRVRMLEQREDPRHDGQAWPAPGETFEVPAWEAEGLTRLDEHHSHPAAVLVGDEAENTDWAADLTQVETHRRMGVEDRSEVPGHGEPPGTARHYADLEAAARNADPADAEAAAQMRAATEPGPEGTQPILDPTAPPPVGGETAGNDPDTPYGGYGKDLATERRDQEQASQAQDQQGEETQRAEETAGSRTGKSRSRGRRAQAAAGRDVPDAETDSSGRAVPEDEDNDE